MGLDANYPAVTMNDPNGTVTVYNQDHVPIGYLGPSPYHSPSVNVTCRLKAWDEAYWYRLLNGVGLLALVPVAGVVWWRRTRGSQA
ncbi:hypothetical protein [Actinopolymorpha pittospori]